MTQEEQMLAWLQRHREHDVIKLITGVRGCGKSTLLNAYHAHLLATGVPESQILQINLEHPEVRHLHTPEELLAFIDGRVPSGVRVHLLLDEIHELQEFDVALGGLFALKNFDIVATCSNKRPISDRFREYLSGRFVHVERTPTPFREIPVRKNISFEKRLNEHLLFGAFPYTFKLRDSLPDTEIYLNGLWNTILVKDILSRSRMADSRLVERLLERIYVHLGEVESLRKLGADATIDGREAAPNTIESYLQALDESMLIRRVMKYDIVLGELAKSGYCFYLSDLALGRTRYGKFPGIEANAIRNLIYLELCARGGAVHCGRYDGTDFDFVTLNQKRPHCWQYAPELVDDRIPTPILSPLKRIPRDVPKTIITRRNLPLRHPSGMEVITLEQFLMSRHATTIL